ncbi:MAG: NAD(P)/FAD-dependent oxidoreductase [Lautropia sp.]
MQVQVIHMNGAGAEQVVVVGGGLAAVSFVNTLVGGGYRGPVTVVAEETEPPYDRPPLSKAFQADGDVEKIRLDLSRGRGAHWLHGVRAVRLEPDRRRLMLDNGRTLDYARVVLATGASPRTLPHLQAAAAPVTTLRSADDARRIRAVLRPGAHLLIVGGGVIGLELAATARGIGADVTLIEAQTRLMNRCAPAQLGEIVLRLHREAGVDLRLGTQVSGVEGGRFALSDGSRLQPDLVVVGIGVRANDALARQAGIACEDGIFVDGHARTDCPDVLAVGDVSRQRHPLTGRLERIETWANAQNQAAAAARALLDPAAPAYADVPWYWSDQYDWRLQIAGLTEGDEIVLRGDPAAGKGCLLQLRSGQLVGAACINNPREFGMLKRLIASGAMPDPDALADPQTDLRKLQ